MAPPEVLWAQRSSETEPEKNVIYLTINVSELDPSYKLEIAPTKISFSGHPKQSGGTGTAAKIESTTYSFDMDLFGEVEEIKRTLTGKNLSLVLRKKEAKAEYWPRLTKDKTKLNYLKTDFSKWVDEDEQDEEEEMPDLGAGAGMGGMPGMGGMGDMGGMGGMGGMGDMAGMMGGMGGGMGGAGGMDFAKLMEQMKASGIGAGGDGEGDAPEEEDEDDEGPPPLESA
ncbi:p23 chaperone protein wos2 [Microbotryomycetes sp. JL221]|nr:p23 chaperone protein wos2 [Microbotryomycetes sp. JL221]